MLIKRNFYNRHTVKVAQDLLGCFLVREYKGKITKAMITETEAYRGEYDLACHASKGRTPRTEIMYGESGHSYVYMIYGMHFMLNVVTEKKYFPAAVLIRGVEIVGNVHGRLLHLNGPGKLTKYFHIDRSFNGYDLTKKENLWLEFRHPMSRDRCKIIKSPRVGIDYARRCKNWKWNFKLVLNRS